ncbi:hypothetical protein [Sorangium sp. So ce381]|uniref:hypothetical protein n=1 Tax=Sorangium sp. So ce381 TaxID=3133307 RepID=UPI003F5B0F7C
MVKVQCVATLLHRALAVIADEPVERALATNRLLFDQRAVACPVVAREREVLRESKGSPTQPAGFR